VTLITLQGGLVVLRGGLVGTEQACCCGGVPCTYSLTVDSTGDPGSSIGWNYCGCCGEYAGDAEKWIEGINIGTAAIVAELRDRGFTVADYPCYPEGADYYFDTRTTLQDYTTCEGEEEPCDAEVTINFLPCSYCVHCDGTLVEDLGLGDLPVTIISDVARDECNWPYPMGGEVAADYFATDSVLLYHRCEQNEFP